MRLVHLSDLHFWHVTLNPLKLAGKRILGMTNLIVNRASKYRMENMPALIGRVQQLEPDHVLVTGDLTTTALEEEFLAVRLALAPLADRGASFSVVPGNHDRYTRDSRRLFEAYFAEFCPTGGFPWVKRVGAATSVVGLDPTHPNPFSAEGTISNEQLRVAQGLLDTVRAGSQVVIACHYPVAVPEGIRERRGHGLRGAGDLRQFLRANAPNLYCHGHIHTPWSFAPDVLPRTLCLNPGAALKRSRTGVRARFFEILLDGDSVQVRQHQLRQNHWEEQVLTEIPAFFRS